MGYKRGSCLSTVLRPFVPLVIETPQCISFGRFLSLFIIAVAQAPVVIPNLHFPVHVHANNIIAVPQAAYNTHAGKYYPNAIFNVTRAQAGGELAKACERIRGLQWTINQQPEAGSPNSALGQKLRAQHAVLWDKANYCLGLI